MRVRALAPGLRLAAVRRLVAAGLACAVITTGIAALLIATLKDRALHNAEQTLVGLSTVLADQADRAFQAVDLVQLSMIEEIRQAKVESVPELKERIARRGVQQTLQARIAALPQASAVSVIDADGTLVNSSRQWPVPPLNLADRGYFKRFQRDDKLETFITGLITNRVDGASTIYNIRRLSTSDGTFLGLVMGALEPRYFESLYERIAPGPDYEFSLWRASGDFLVTSPFRPRDPAIHSLAIAEITERGLREAVTRRVSRFDGQDRLIALKSLEHFPVVMRVSLSADAALAGWRQQAIVFGGCALLLDLGIVGLVLLGVRQLRAQERLDEATRREIVARQRGEAQLRAQYERFGTALDNMTQGLCMVDRAGRLIVMNKRFAQMHSLPSGLSKPGIAIDDIVAGIAARNGNLAASIWGPGCESAGASITLDLADHRTISVAYAPIPEGGWICTHEDITERKRDEARIVYMAHHDALTGLPNRVRLREHMVDVLGGVHRGDEAAVLCLDLDGFKQVNDSLGHPAGDQLLCLTAQRLRDTIRSSDLVVRLGGDEFAVITTSKHGTDNPAKLAERLVGALRAPFELGDTSVEIGVSIGIAHVTAHNATADDLLRSADIALYHAKAAGRGTWRTFHPEMDTRLRARQAMVADLRQALNAGQFQVAYQPLVRADTEEIIGVEALLRWYHPVRGIVSPADFIPLAEDSGLIRPIGAWVLRQACADAALWPADIKIAVNLSPIQFASGELIHDVEEALEQAGIAPARLELEVTESTLLQDNEATLAQLHRLRGAGVRICMDDFGTGYSSLSYLRRFPFDKIKVDQSFVRTMQAEPGSIEILRAIVGLANALHMNILAEGVETTEQRDILRAEGYRELQGYLFGRPQSSQSITTTYFSYIALPAAPALEQPVVQHA